MQLVRRLRSIRDDFAFWALEVLKWIGFARTAYWIMGKCWNLLWKTQENEGETGRLAELFRSSYALGTFKYSPHRFEGQSRSDAFVVWEWISHRLYDKSYEMILLSRKVFNTT